MLQVSIKKIRFLKYWFNNNKYIYQHIIQVLDSSRIEKEEINEEKKEEEIDEQKAKLSEYQKLEILSKQIKLPTDTIKKFFDRNPVPYDYFLKLCSFLEVKWEDIVDTDFIEILIKIVPEVRVLRYSKIKEQCGTLRILDVSRPIDLDQLYVDLKILENPVNNIYLDISALPEIYNSETNEFDRSAFARIDQKRFPSILVVKSYSRLVVLGKPGSGKSTFLQNIAVQCNEGDLERDRVPIFIQLRNLNRDVKETNDFSILQYIIEEFRNSGLTELSEIETLLQYGRLFILLDGLDEVSKQNKVKIVDEICTFSEKYYRNKFIITCRTSSENRIFSKFTYVEIADFTNEQIKLFAKKWFKTLEPKIGIKKANKFLQKLNADENIQIRELAVTPILLVLLCLVFQAKKEFPNKRYKLYKEGLEILLKRWDESRGIERDKVYRYLTLVQKKKLLSLSAINFFEKDNYYFEQDDIEEVILDYLSTLRDPKSDLDELIGDSEAVLKSLEVQHGLLIKRAKKIYSFSHLTFQEYFVALNFQDSDCSKLISKITEKRWREIFLLTNEMLPNSVVFWQRVKQYVDAMIASNPKLQEFLAWVNEKAHSARSIHLVNNPYKENAVRAVYFAHHLSLNIDLGVMLDPKLTSVQRLALDFHHKSLLDHARDINIARQVERDIALDIVLYHALYHQKIHANPSIAIDRAIDRTLDVAINRKAAKNFAHSLNNLKDELISQGKYGNSENWTEKLRNVMIKYRNIGQNWQFSENEKKLLNQYYEANKLLLDYLDNAFQVSSNVKQNIKTTLLLPIQNKDTE